MNILVTGYPGFLARNLHDYISRSKKLQQEKHSWTFCHYRSSGFGNNTKKGIKYRFVNLHNAPDVIKIITEAKPDVIFHLAAFANNAIGPGLLTQGMFLDNIRMCKNLIENAPNGCRFVLASSSTVYGNGYGGASTEDDPCNPTSIYGASKVACEALVRACSNSGSIKGLSVRFPAMVGRHMTHGLLKDLLVKIKQKGPLKLLGKAPGSIKPFLHVSDAIKGLLRFGLDEHLTGCVNICPNDNVSVEEVAREILQHSGIRKKIQFQGEDSAPKGDNPVVLMSNESAEAYGFKVQKSSLDAIVKAYYEN